MKYLNELLGNSFFDNFGTAEWVYFGVGIVALVTLVITVVVAIKNNKLEEPTKDEVVASAAEAVVAETEPVTVVEKPVEIKPVKEASKPSEHSATVERAVYKSSTKEEIKPSEYKSDRDIVKRGKVQILYNKSYTAKLMQADNTAKAYYDVLKNEIMSYKGVRSRISWKHESFFKGRKLVAKLKMKVKNLHLLLPLDANDYVDTKYKVKDLSAKKNHADAPCVYTIKNDTRSVYAKDLIAVVMQSVGAQKVDKDYVKYSAEFPYDTTENLIYRKLIKLNYSRVVDEDDGESHYEQISEITAEEVTTLMTDEEAVESVEESARISDKTKTGIVNVDVLSKTFSAGERVTLAEIKKRVVGFNKKTTYIKVLARGVIDKPLIVEADDYSIDAVKMILLTGGKVIRTKKN